MEFTQNNFVICCSNTQRYQPGHQKSANRKGYIILYFFTNKYCQIKQCSNGVKHHVRLKKIMKISVSMQETCQHSELLKNMITEHRRRISECCYGPTTRNVDRFDDIQSTTYVKKQQSNVSRQQSSSSWYIKMDFIYPQFTMT